MQRAVNRPRCVVNGCQNNQRLLTAENYTGVAWFHFPLQHSLLMKKWRAALQKVNDWCPASNDVVCVAHFVPKDIASSPYGRPKTLKPEAVPSVFDMCVKTIKTIDPYDLGPEYLPTIRLQRIDQVLEIIDQRVKLRPTGKSGGSKSTPSRKRPNSRRRSRTKRPRLQASAPAPDSDEDLMASFPEVEVLLEEPPSPARPPPLVPAASSQIKIKLPASVLDSPKQLFVRRQDLPKDLRHSVTSNKKLWIKTSGPNARHLMVNVVDDVPQGAKSAALCSESQPSDVDVASTSPAVEGTSSAERRVPPLIAFPPLATPLPPAMMFLDHATFGHKIRPFAHNTSAVPAAPVSVIPSAGQPRMVFASSETAKTFLSRALQGVKSVDQPTGGDQLDDEARVSVEHDHEYSQYSSIRFSRGNVYRLERQVAELTKALAKARSELQLIKLNHKVVSLDPAPPPLKPPAAPVVTIRRPENWLKIGQPSVWSMVPPDPRALLAAPAAPRALVRQPQKVPARTHTARTNEDFEEMMPRFEQVNVPDDFGHHFMAGWQESGDIIESA